MNSAVTLIFAPYRSTQALYYTTYGGTYGGGSGQLRRVAYSGTANRAPTAVIAAAPTAGAAPLTVSFTGSGSSDPDASDTLTYRWSFGDGSATVDTTSATTTHTYAAIGTYTATLVVRDRHGALSAPASVRIDVGNTPPVPRIDAPAATDHFAVGQTITLHGSATDEQDGTLPASALSWRVNLRHDTHTHPFVAATSGSGLTFVAPAPEDLAAATTSYLEIELTATDAQGRTSVVRQALRPQLVDLTFTTEPRGLRLEVNGATLRAPRTVTSWAGYVLQVRAPDQQDSTGQWQVFRSWSDGGTSAHSITTPVTAATYSARFGADSPGTGLRATYFDQLDFTGTTVTRTDPTVNYSWGTGAPVSGIGGDTFSVRWTGLVMPQYSETYTFATTSDDGVRLWVNGKQLVDNWTNHGPTENSGSVTLEAGKQYPITMEFYDNTGGAVAKLAWSSARQVKQIVPQNRLSPHVAAKINFQPATAAVPANYMVDSGSVYGQRGNGFHYGWSAENSARTRDRNAVNAPDQRYDTLTHLPQATSPPLVWEIAVPTGSYTVRVVAGDPSYSDSVYKMNVEGTLTVNGTPTSSARWVEGTATVYVSDGRLTLSTAAGASNNKVCFIEIMTQ